MCICVYVVTSADKSVVIYGTECQRKLQLLEKADKSMEEKSI